MKQLSFFEEEKSIDNQEWGTFKDSLRAPIHNWFTYPAGFSYKAVESSIHTNGIRQGQTIYDPFMGSGTTNLVAKKLAIHSYGIEAHPFVFRITRTKMNWEIDQYEHDLRKTIFRLVTSAGGTPALPGVLRKSYKYEIDFDWDEKDRITALNAWKKFSVLTESQKSQIGVEMVNEIEDKLKDLVLSILDDTARRKIKNVKIELHSNLGEVKVYEFSNIEKAVEFLNTTEMQQVFIISDSLTLFDPPPDAEDNESGANYENR
jgi:hypothetical protein